MGDTPVASSYYFGNFSCYAPEGLDSPCVVQCTLCKLLAETKGGDIDPRTNAEKLQAIRRHNHRT